MQRLQLRIGDLSAVAQCVDHVGTEFPLELQFRGAVNLVLIALSQAAGAAVPLHEASYGLLTDVRYGIALTGAHAQRFGSARWAEANETVDLTLPNGVRFVMSAEADIRDWMMPKLYFQVGMAYALLRKAGVPLGKINFIPFMARHVANTCEPRQPSPTRAAKAVPVGAPFTECHG